MAVWTSQHSYLRPIAPLMGVAMSVLPKRGPNVTGYSGAMKRVGYQEKGRFLSAADARFVAE